MVLLLRESFWDAICSLGILPEGLLISFFYSYYWALLCKTVSEGHCFGYQGVFPDACMKVVQVKQGEILPLTDMLYSVLVMLDFIQNYSPTASVQGNPDPLHYTLSIHI